MNYLSKILNIFDFRIKQDSFDGNLPIGHGNFSGKTGDYIDICFPRLTDINLITLFEKGDSVTDFEIYAEKDGSFKMIYKQNRISNFRVCAIEDTKTSKIRIKILGTRKGSFKEIKAFLYNLPKKERPFRKTAYIVVDNFEDVDRENLKYYNKFNLIGAITMDESGNVTLPNDKFENALKMVRDFDENANVVATIFSSGDNVNTFKNPETPYNIKTFLDKYNLNGVSFDWEYPKNHYEWKIFEKAIINLKEIIGGKTVTLALPSWCRYHFTKKAIECIDTVEVMTYDDMARDIDGHHSEFFMDGPNSIYHFAEIGFDLSQLDLGLPFYARPVDAAGYWSDYKKEVDKLDKFTNVANDEYEDVDWKKKTITVKPRFYNCVQMIEDKTAFCIYANVGGIMVWALASDTPESHELCLSKTIAKTVERRTKN